MHKSATTLIVAVAWMSLSLPLGLHAQSATFEQQYAKAKANAATEAGAAYDNQLSAVTQSYPDFLSSMRDCVSKNPSRSTLHGYYDFASASHYRVVLRPESPFANCVSAVLENRQLPSPPRTPYLNPFDFNLTD